jgi:hypothetical protein
MRSRRLYLERHVFEFVIGVLSIIAAISFATDPESLRWLTSPPSCRTSSSASAASPAPPTPC